MANLSLKNLNKTYANGFTAVHDLNLDIVDGEFLVLVGPSGCGKSTTLRMVAGLERISSGDLHIGDQRVNELEPADRDIAMVFQNYALYPHMTVFKNMAYGLKNRGEKRVDIEQKVRDAARTLDIEHLLDSKPAQLSGGQRQRVAMGRAIVRSPQVFLFDEPLSNLDAKLRVQMRIEIKRLQQRFGTTAIYVTHDQVEAMTLADRLVVMNGGKVEQVGPPIELYEKPASRFVAGFIGSPSMNFLNVQLEGGRTLVLPNGQRVELPDAVNHSGEVVLGFRPEHLESCSPEQSDFTLSVEIVEPLGADTLLYGNFPNTDVLVLAEQSGKAHFHGGESLPLRFDRQRLHLFDPHSELRIV
ncbi:ABC transporter ATP-binding protein [Saccharospirillum mangrovi]|uniref:ABC transporter ATP-binding protein n=1 Tax=Saccharospirillum mangrovi TaxID=2161747 RepID=UPI000D3609FE|nr:sn-glycerol-3-phosphate import ATP-binding protein UgpC [Saccharospirillum mangrovi]